MARPRGRIGALLACVLGACALLVPPAATAADQQLPTPVTAGALPTPQTNGTVLAVAIVGDTVYAGGTFTMARPAGVPEGGAGAVARDNLLAFDLHTGELLPFAPSVSATEFGSTQDPGPWCTSTGPDRWVCDAVFRITGSPDGSRVYIGGDFDKINGRWRSRVAAFDTASRELVPGFHPRVAGRVRGLSVTRDRVYLGGAFSAVNGQPRTRLAAVTTEGTLLPWAPSADDEVFSVLASPEQGRVIVGGSFDSVNGEQHRALMAVDSTTGANVNWAWTAPSQDDVVTDIVTDGSGVAYLGAYNWHGTNPRFEGRAAVRIATGETVWMDGCYGDTQGVAVADGVLYAASHTHDCSAMGALPEGGPVHYQRLTAQTTAAMGTADRSVNHVQAGDPIPALLPWLPNTNGGPSDSAFHNGPWAIDASADYVVVGGEFTTVNGEPQQSLVRFAARSVPGAADNGPQIPFPAPSVQRHWLSRDVVIEWTGTWDAQNRAITYQVMRVGTPEPIHTVTRTSWPWSIPSMSFTDTQAPDGTVQYWIRAVDEDGEAIGSPRGSTRW